MLDADGSPRAYAPIYTERDEDGNREKIDPPLKALDYLANAGEEGNWYGVATNKKGLPYRQGPSDPYPGYFVSTTALEDSQYAASDPRRYVDSEKVPYIVLPGGSAGFKAWGVKLGAKGRATNQKNGKSVDIIFGDIGPAKKIGEASIACADALGIASNPKKGGTDDKIILYEVYC